MPDISVTLSSNETALLKIMAEGGSVANLGEHSRWSAPLEALVTRGFATSHDQHNHTITAAGRAVLSAAEDDEIRALIGTNNELVAMRSAEEEIAAEIDRTVRALTESIRSRLPPRRWDAAAAEVQAKLRTYMRR